MLSNPTKKKGGKECFRIPAKYTQIQIEHTPCFWEGGGVEVQFFSCHKVVVPFPIWLIQHFFCWRFATQLPGLIMFVLWVFWKVCEPGVFALLFCRTQQTQFVTHDCQKNSTCNFAVIIYQVKDVRGRYLDTSTQAQLHCWICRNGLLDQDHHTKR